MKLPNRIRELRTARGWTLQELAERAETSNQQIGRLETGQRKLTQEWMLRLADAFGVEPTELLPVSKGSEVFGNPEYAERRAKRAAKIPSAPGMVVIDELDAGAGAAAGGYVNASLENNGGDTFETVHVRRQWVLPAELTSPVTSAPSDQLKIIPIVGNSMAPDFPPGQKVLVDLTDRTPSPPGVFVVWDGLNLVVKLVEYIPFSDPPTVRLMSVNPAFAPYERTLDEAYIQGRVIGTWQWT